MFGLTRYHCITRKIHHIQERYLCLKIFNQRYLSYLPLTFKLRSGQNCPYENFNWLKTGEWELVRIISSMTFPNLCVYISWAKNIKIIFLLISSCDWLSGAGVIYDTCVYKKRTYACEEVRPACVESEW